VAYNIIPAILKISENASFNPERNHHAVYKREAGDPLKSHYIDHIVAQKSL
jgi:hypothetical protein